MHERKERKELQRRERVPRVQEHLTVDDRYLVEQRALGREWSDLAAELGCDAESLRKRLRRALSRVTDQLVLPGIGVLGLFAAGLLDGFQERRTDELPVGGSLVSGVLCLAALAALVAHWMHGHAPAVKKHHER
jgi:hypothetical protein